MSELLAIAPTLRPFSLLQNITEDVNQFLEYQGKDLGVFLLQRGVFTQEDIKALWEGIAGVMHWLYDRLTEFETLMMPLDAAFAVLESIAVFVEGVIDIMKHLPPYGNESPLAAVYSIVENVAAIFPNHFNAQEVIDKLSALPGPEEIADVKKSILTIIGTGTVPAETLPAGVDDTIGSIPDLINNLATNPQ